MNFGKYAFLSDEGHMQLLMFESKTITGTFQDGGRHECQIDAERRNVWE